MMTYYKPCRHVRQI